MSVQTIGIGVLLGITIIVSSFYCYAEENFSDAVEKNTPARSAEPDATAQGYEDGVAQGVINARSDLKSGEARMYTYGRTLSWHNYDRKTGLTFTAIAGCIVNSYIRGLADGYNRTVKDEIKRMV